jgi:hypothetical protein
MTTGSGKSVADTSFDEALDSLREFLSGQGLSTHLIWVFREDVIFQGERIFIKTPWPAENEARARACYELGQKRGFGVNLKAFCLLESRPCCYILLPEDDLDAQYLLMSNISLKLSVWTNLRNAESISNPVKWLALKLMNPKSQFSGFDDHIPSKRSLLPEYRVAHAG